jgi:methylglutamate dehydrogenase subunit B
MRIPCPFCGERDSGEFTYLGAHVERPGIVSPDLAEQFYEAVYIRENPSGRHRDLWYHAFGCGNWLVVTRDTRSHEIFEVELASGAGPR